MRAPPEIVEADHRGAVLESQIHDLAYLSGVSFAERAAKDGEILRKDVGQPAVDGAPAGNDPIARDDGLFHAELHRAVGDEHVVFFEGAGIEQHIDALAGGELALCMLGVDPLLPAAKASVGALLVERGDNGVHCVPCPAPLGQHTRAWGVGEAG